MLQTKTKVFLTVCALTWMAGGAIAASPVKADFVVRPASPIVAASSIKAFDPCPGDTCPEPSGTYPSGSR